MGLKAAAAYFARTPLLGWNGTAFVDLGIKGSFQPYDRFISEREFGNKRRMMLVNPDTPIPDDCYVLRLGANGPIYIKGSTNQDIQYSDPYSLIHLVLIAEGVGQLIQLIQTPKSSGRATTITDSIVGSWHCNTERLTYSNSAEFTQNRISEYTVSFPLDCPANQDNEFVLGNRRFVLQEVYTTSGFIQARAQVKFVN